MRKFRFSKSTPANVANPAKVPVNKEYTVAKPLLTIAKVDQKIRDNTVTLANISNTLADQEPCKINNLSNFSKISRGGRSIPEKSTLQKQIDDLWNQADELPENKSIQPEDCPARCKLTGKCYGIAYFDAKPGKALLCMPDQCPWSDQLKQHFNKKEN